ncbi:hypothetical protein OKW98_16740 [Pseudomonas sp. KU26590]|uniref:hypothetical protein n=1 Tax=Pseudomonas sp. KU26590 TaxID=2991051 RepID=UPI00223CD662|nr:hypothetical protein [Pseudomonas sp. KU26590]UZJ58250.1 hypothetical protein OKW98_16740 [Pseudomonas sp. KU26590]
MSNQSKRLSNCAAERLAVCREDVAPAGDGVDFGIDCRSVRVSQEAYSIFIAREQMGKDRVAALQQRLNIADQKINDLEHARGQRLEVNPISLRALLIAVTGAPHEIREIQACLGIPDNPIDQLLREYNDWVYAPAAKLDSSMTGIVHTPPVEYDEP